MTRKGAVALALALAGASGACATLRPITASATDYADYREVRLASGLGARLGASWRYLREHPDGAWAEEVGAWFRVEEPRFHAEAGRTPGGASAYLSLMPDGPHAQDARDFLRAFERERIEGPKRAKEALEEARRRAEVARKALGEAIETWTRRAAAITTWGEDLARLELVDKDFSVPFRKQEPYAECDADGCVKKVVYRYGIPDASPPEDRTPTLEVRLELDHGKVFAVTLTAKRHGFTWWLEGAEARSVDPKDEATRTEAVMRAKNRVELAVREVRGASCKTVEEPASRLVECGTLRVVVEPMSSGDDVVRIIGSKS